MPVPVEDGRPEPRRQPRPEPNRHSGISTMTATQDDKGRNPSRKRRSPLPGSEAIDEMIERHLADFDRVPLQRRNAVAALARVAAELSPEHLVTLLAVASQLRAAERAEQGDPPPA